MKIDIPNRGVKNLYAKKRYSWTLISFYVFKSDVKCKCDLYKFRRYKNIQMKVNIPNKVVTNLYAKRYMGGL